MGDGEVFLKDGVQIDLGAVGKGIGCDEARKMLEEADADAAVVSVGGSILTYGKSQMENHGRSALQIHAMKMVNRILVH